MSIDIDSIADAFSSLLRGEESIARLEEAELGWSPALWHTIVANGFAAIAAPEAQGGAGAELAALGAVVERAGYHAAPAPLAQANIGALGAALLDGSVPQRTTAIAVELPRRAISSGDTEPLLDRPLRNMPWSSCADEVLILLQDGADTAFFARIARAACDVTEDRNIAGEPRGQWTPRQPIRMRAAPVRVARQLCDLLVVTRASAMAGAARRVLDLSLRYANDRHQFGRAIFAFQAVQHELAELAASVEQLDALLHEAYERTDGGEDGHLWALAVQTCAGLAAARAIRSGHQVHGAIGITMEYELQRHTRRLMAWRDERGSETLAARELGSRLRAAEPGLVWGVSTATFQR